jgi:two-component system, LytTR family, sensor kinase
MTRRPDQPPPAYWKWAFGLWLGVSAILFLSRWVLHENPARALGFTAVVDSMAFVGICLLKAAYDRLEDGEGFTLRTAWRLVGLSFTASAGLSAFALGFVRLTGWWIPGWTPLEEVLLRFLLYWLTFLAASFLYFWLLADTDARRRGAEAERARAEATRLELLLLRAQLDPHLLFNSLNGIAALIPAGATTALALVHQLSRYLRYSLDHRHQDSVPVADEVAAMRTYLEIEKTRFGDALLTNVTCEPPLPSRRVPCFLLQPLVENAVKHGFATAQPPLEVSLRVQESAWDLRIVVTNSGCLGEGPAGVGLEVLLRRLQLQYPGRHRFRIRQDGGRVVCTLIVRGEPAS